MPELRTFISPKFRPDVLGGRLDKTRTPIFKLKHHSTPKVIETKALCFGPSKDNVLINLEHAIIQADHIQTLYYEDLHKSWTFINTPTESYFLIQQAADLTLKVKPKTLYIRGCYIEPTDPYWLLLGDFFAFVELWDGQVICPPKKQMANESKLYQLANSLKKSATPTVSIGVSYVLKGFHPNHTLDDSKDYIVKSLSGVRSVVVDRNDYHTWNFNNLNHLPALFQEKAQGHDLRVHTLDQQVYALRSDTKTHVDYRYDTNFFKLKAVEVDEELKSFCLKVCHEEANLLMGLDFIQTETGYVSLEANPSPGWSAYHPYDGIKAEPFLSHLLGVLKRA